MQSGDSVDCPHCGEKTIVKTKNRMDGFAIVGSCLVCALCGAELGGAEPASGDAAGQKAAERLAALLGEGAAPEGMPASTPSVGARARLAAKASSAGTVTTRSTTERSSTAGTKPAPMP